MSGCGLWTDELDTKVQLAAGNLQTAHVLPQIVRPRAFSLEAFHSRCMGRHIRLADREARVRGVELDLPTLQTVCDPSFQFLTKAFKMFLFGLVNVCVQGANVLDIVRAQTLVLTQSALEALTERLTRGL